MASKVARQARLQRRILDSLHDAPAESVTALARRVDAARPSASRSLQRLEAAGLVSRVGRSWQLTADGDACVADEAGRKSRHFVDALQVHAKFQEQLMMLSGVGAIAEPLGAASQLTAAIGSIDKIKLNPDLTAAIGSIAKIKLNPDLTTAIGSIAKIKLNPDLTAAIGSIDKISFGSAFASVYKSLELQMSQMRAGAGAWSALIADNLSTTSRIAADIAAMSTSSAMAIEFGSLHGLVGHSVASVVEAHERQLADAIDQAVRAPASRSFRDLVVRPTATTAAFTGAARAAYVPEQRPRETVELLETVVRELADELNELGAIATARDLRAAHDSLLRRNAGWPKAAAHLLREALREVLEELAPAHEVTADANGFVTRRARVVWLVGGNETLGVWVDITAGNLGKLHEVLSAEAKNNGEPRLGHEGIVGMLEVVTGLLRTVADRIKERRQIG